MSTPERKPLFERLRAGLEEGVRFAKGELGNHKKLSMVEDWRELRVGDRIRIVRMPSAAALEGYALPRDTRRLYRLLIARNRPLRVYMIDKQWQLPWVKCLFRTKKGNWEYHYLAVNDDSWVRVKSRA
jgi:hypothetical protein